MAIGSSQCVGGVEVVGLEVETKVGLQHGEDLLFRGSAVTGNVLLDACRLVFRKWDVSTHGGGYRNSLGATEF